MNVEICPKLFGEQLLKLGYDIENSGSETAISNLFYEAKQQFPDILEYTRQWFVYLDRCLKEYNSDNPISQDELKKYIAISLAMLCCSIGTIE
jgi:hypothetical protein